MYLMVVFYLHLRNICMHYTYVSIYIAYLYAVFVLFCFCVWYWMMVKLLRAIIVSNNFRTTQSLTNFSNQLYSVPSTHMQISKYKKIC